MPRSQRGEAATPGAGGRSDGVLEVKSDSARIVILPLIAVLILVGLTLFFGVAGIKTKALVDELAAAEPRDPVVVVDRIETPVFASRETINDTVKAMIIAGRSEDVYVFYDQFTKNREITHALVNTALLSGIPINLLFALVQWESNYNPRALNINSGSSDQGLMQLNSRTFSALSEEELYDPVVNIRHGAQYLADRFAQYGSWEAAVIAYNGGNTELVKGITVRHLVNVLSNEREYDRAFVEAFGE